MAGTAVTLRGARLRYGHHVIWDNLDLDIAPGNAWPSWAQRGRQTTLQSRQSQPLDDSITLRRDHRATG